MSQQQWQMARFGASLQSRAADTPLLIGCWVVLERQRERTGKALMVGTLPLKVVSPLHSVADSRQSYTIGGMTHT